MNERIVLATANPGKVREFNELLEGRPLSVLAQSQFGVPEAEETGLSFVENAILKARNASAHSGLPAMADDSGLEVDALKGAPGIYSARFAGPEASDQDNCDKLLDDLNGVPAAERSARFRCVMVSLRHAADPTPVICTGTWEGIITEAPSGDNGFGYDPVFWVPDEQCTAAELPAAKKNSLSHRGQALRCMLEQLI